MYTRSWCSCYKLNYHSIIILISRYIFYYHSHRMINRSKHYHRSNIRLNMVLLLNRSSWYPAGRLWNCTTLPYFRPPGIEMVKPIPFFLVSQFKTSPRKACILSRTHSFMKGRSFPTPAVTVTHSLERNASSHVYSRHSLQQTMVGIHFRTLVVGLTKSLIISSNCPTMQTTTLVCSGTLP